jgi:AcrR family transcriptional regulator
MPKISQSAFNERRAHILDAARQSFARRGIHVSVDEICLEAGVSKGALYGYFPSKDAIIQAIADSHAADFEAIAQAPDLAGLQALLIARANDVDPEGCRLEMEAWTYSLTHDALRDRLRENTSALRAAIQRALSGLQAAGKIRLRVDVAAAAAVIETFAMGAVAKAALSGEAEAGEMARRLSTLMSALMDVHSANA